MPGNLTVWQAEASLGRPLTWLEHTWVQGTAGWTPYNLHVFLIGVLLASYICSNVPFLVLQYLNIPWLEKYRIQKVPATDGRAAVSKCITTVLGDLFALFGPLAVTSFPVFKISGISASLPLPSFAEIALHLGTFFLFQDFWDYWLHRWLHTPWAFRIIHYRHHEFTAPTSVAATYAHPLELMIFGIPLYLGPLIVQCHLVTWWAWLFVRELQAAEVHSGYDFPWSPNKFIPFYGGAAFHDRHHSAGGTCKSNFGDIFTWCDAIYGTNSKVSHAKRTKSSRVRRSSPEEEERPPHKSRVAQIEPPLSSLGWKKLLPRWPFERIASWL